VEHTGEPHDAPQYFLMNLKKFRRLCKAISRKVKGSENQKAAKWHLSRQHLRIVDKRRDFHFYLAHKLCKRYEVLVFEDLNIAAMKLLWGRKISDLGFSQFLKIIEWVAFKQGKTVLKLERFTPTTQLCSDCGHRQKLSLKERVFHCEACGMQKDRDHNAAINIQKAGASAYTKRDLCKTSS
jgi:putative transposase